MNYENLIKKICSDKEIKKTCKKIGGDLSDDLYQELIIIILEYNKQSLLDIESKGYLNWFIVKILTNQFRSNSSYFSKLYRPKPVLILPDVDYVEQVDNDINFIESELNKVHWYESKLMKEYIKMGSYRKLSAETGIPFTSISRTINKVKDKIKNEYNIKHNCIK